MNNIQKIYKKKLVKSEREKRKSQKGTKRVSELIKKKEIEYARIFFILRIQTF